MAFDLTTARPVEETEQPQQRGKFDISTARPVEDAAQTAPQAAEPEGPGYMDLQKQVAGGLVEPALALGSAGVGEIAGGLTGLATLGATATGRWLGLTDADPAAAAEAVREGVADRLTYEPRTAGGQAALPVLTAPSVPGGIALQKAGEATGEVGYRVGGPEVGAVTSAIPMAAAQYLGAKIPGAGSKALRSRADAADTQALRVQSEIDTARAERSTAPPERPTTEGVGEVAAELSKKKPDVADIAEFDPAVVKAAEELGFDEIPASVAAGNAQFRDVAQGMASIAGSEAKAQYGAFLEGLSRKADDLIKEGGGDLDKPAVSSRYRDESNRVIDELGAQEDGLYQKIDYLVPAGEKIELPGLKKFVDSKTSEYGSVADMPPLLKRVHNLAYGKMRGQWMERHPTSKLFPEAKTYQSFSQLRKEVGQALNRKSGPFKDSEVGMLKQVYAAMKPVQMDLARKFGAVDLQQAADALTIKRKAVEDTMVDALGRDLSKDLMPQVAAKITGLPKGNVTKFNQFIEGVPEGMRREVVVSALNDLLRGTGADQKGLGAARFVGFMNDLNRSPIAKNALYKYLSPATRSSLNNLYTLSNGVYRANKENITTGKIAQFFPDNRTFLGKMMGGAIKGTVTLKAGAAGGPGGAAAGAAAVDGIAQFLSNSTPKARTANQFIASPELQQVIKSAVRDGVIEGKEISRKTRQLEKLAEKSAKYRRWADMLEGGAKAQLVSLGLVNYLLGPPEGEGE